MLKVVGASWLQTRISTYILVAVVLFGISAIIIGEFGQSVENDGTYSATVSWNHKGGYRIDFWGQGNDLNGVKLNVARAYYKTSILESGWSIIEIETSSKYPDTVQAYAAGLLEGSLTWQLIHHHWYNTVNAVCEKRVDECRKLMRFLRENTAIIRERAELLEASDPFWHMVRLFYIQLDGLETGWKFAVRRSRQTVEIDSEHFLWLAMAADLPDLELALNVSDYTKGMIFLKNLLREGLDPLVAIGHTTAAPYAKMLRLLKKYTFGYHVLPIVKTAAPIPGKSVMMSSYPGALSSHDEFYLIRGQNRELIVAGTPLATIINHRSLWNFTKLKDQVMTAAKIMAANRLSTDGRSWSRVMLLQNSSGRAWRWVALEPRYQAVWEIEQMPGIIRAANISEQFVTTGILYRTGKNHLRETKLVNANDDDGDHDDHAKNEDAMNELIVNLQENITTVEHFRKFMRDYSHKNAITTLNKNEDQTPQLLAYKEDLEQKGKTLPFGIIDMKIILTDIDGVESFEAISGPSTLSFKEPFCWSKTFPNVSHLGQPDIFDFDSIVPLWAWI